MEEKNEFPELSSHVIPVTPGKTDAYGRRGSTAPGPGSGRLIFRAQYSFAPAEPTNPSVATRSPRSSRWSVMLNCCIWPFRKSGVTPFSANNAGPCFRFGELLTIGKPCDAVVVGI